MISSLFQRVPAGPYRDPQPERTSPPGRILRQLGSGLLAGLGVLMISILTLVPTAAAQNDVIDQIPAEVIAELEAREPDIVRGLRDGSITEIPGSVVDALPDSISAEIPDGLTEGASGTFIAILIGVGVLAIAGFFYGMVKSAMKAAMFFAVVAAIAFFVLFTL